MSARYWVGGTASWDSTAGTKWALTSGGAGGQAVPTSSDDVFFNAASGAVTVTKVSPAGACRNLNFTGFTGTFTGAVGTVVSGDLVLGSSMTLTYTGLLTMNSTTSQIISTNGITITSSLTLDGVGGTWVLQSNLTSNFGVTLTNGAFNANGFSVTVPSFSSSNTNVRTISMGGGLWSLTGAGSVWVLNVTTNLTFATNSSSIKLTNVSSSQKTFFGGSLTYNILWLSGAGTGIYTIGGSNTFTELRIDTPPHTIKMEASRTQTIPLITANGVSGSLNTFQSSVDGTPWNLSASSGTISLDYVSLQDSHAAGGATFNATNSTNVSGNTGWYFYNTALTRGFFIMANRALGPTV